MISRYIRSNSPIGLIQFVLLVPFLSLFFSCEKQKDTLSPEIVFTKPFENQFYNVGDTILVSAIISDECALKTISLFLSNESYIRVLDNFTYTPQSNEFHLKTSYHIYDLSLNTGNYYLTLQASDGFHTRTERVLLNIGAAPMYRPVLF
jgi:hypothetical protein